MLANNDSKPKYVLFTPVGGNDPIGDEYDKDSEEKLKDYIKSNNDPVIIEGPILHIVRHYKPKCVLLLFTQRDNDMDSKFRILKREIRKLSNDCIIRRIIHIGASYATNWEEGIIDFNDKLQKLLNGFEDCEVLINITSASPQISFKLSNEIINNNRLKGIQVDISLKELHTQMKKDKKYIDNNIRHTNEEYENNINRCIEPKIYSVIKPKLKSQIESLISVNNKLYNYQALYRLLKGCDELFKNELFENVSKANERINLIYHHKDEAAVFFEYYFAMKVKQIKGELSDFFLRITPFVTELLYYYLKKDDRLNYYFSEKGSIKYVNIGGKTVYITIYKLNSLLEICNINIDIDIFNLLKKFLIIEDTFRQDIAHRLISIDENEIPSIYIRYIIRHTINLVKDNKNMYTNDILNNFIDLIVAMSKNIELYYECHKILISIKNDGNKYINEKCK